jgi:hypothetical protein
MHNNHRAIPVQSLWNKKKSTQTSQTKSYRDILKRLGEAARVQFLQFMCGVHENLNSECVIKNSV